MKLSEIINYDGLQRRVDLMKQNAKRQGKLAKRAQARLKMLRAQQQLGLARQSATNALSE